MRFIILLSILFFSLSPTVYSEEKIDPTGTFSSLEYVEEGGDLVGEEIKIVYTSRSGYQAAIQFAEGEPSELIVVKVNIKGNKVQFEIAEPDTFAGVFTGTLDIKGLKGVYRYKKGGLETNWNLPRKASYWDN